MNWRTPSEGDMREVIRFAWLPVALGHGRMIWFERYVSREWLKRIRSGASDEWVLRWVVREQISMAVARAFPGERRPEP